jgi:hypothetical protein
MSAVRPSILLLLLLLAFSPIAAWGRKPPQRGTVEVTVRPMSASEIKEILLAVPGWLPRYDRIHLNDDTTRLVNRYPYMEVTAAQLRRIFPKARFYNGIRNTSEGRQPYVVAIAGHKLYPMLSEFNQLLLESGITISDKNVLELAKTFIAVVAGERRTVIEVTFLDQKLAGHAWLEVSIGEQIQRWDFEYEPTRFGAIHVRNAKGTYINEFNVPEMWLDDTPRHWPPKPSP